jgi:hypothetical protein
MPIWFHQKSTASRTLFTGGQHHKDVIRCLKVTHEMHKTGDAEDLALKLRTARHKDGKNCRCTTCVEFRNTGCRDPNRCMRRARDILSSLLPKWNPLLPQPEDWETEMEDIPPPDEDTKVFDGRVTTTGTLADAFCIFTDKATSAYHAEASLRIIVVIIVVSSSHGSPYSISSCSLFCSS